AGAGSSTLPLDRDPRSERERPRLVRSPPAQRPMPFERGSRHRGAPAPSRERRPPNHRELEGVPFSYVGPSFERRQELVDLVDRDGKADADAAVNGALDRVVDADDLAL